MKLGIVIGTKEPETVWNAFRLGNASLEEGHQAKVFLMNSGVEIEDIDDERYDVAWQEISSGPDMLCR